MLSLSLDGAEALDARLAALPAGLRADLAEKAARLGAALADKMRMEKLSGQVLNARSGALAGSIVAEAGAEDGAIVARVGVAGDVKYAAIQEYGGRTAAHEIMPTKAAALAFVSGGALRFARRVEHPGSIIPERSYLRSSLAEMAEAIVAEFAAAPAAAWERS
jgi:phage gpG-like protein